MIEKPKLLDAKVVVILCLGRFVNSWAIGHLPTNPHESGERLEGLRSSLHASGQVAPSHWVAEYASVK